MKKMSQNLIKMRNRNLIIVALLLLCTQTLCSQKIDQHLDMNNMSFFKEATLVVEGRFLKPVFSYAVKDIQGKEHYYGICPVITYKVFKGNAKAGDTIYVTREGRSFEEISTCILDYYPYTKVYRVDPFTGDSVELDFDIQYDYPQISFSKRIDVLSQFVDNCVLFFKASTFPKTKEEPYASLPQYQYLYPYVFYDEGTKLYISNGKFAGLNDTLFNSREDLYRFMLEAGGYDTTVVKISEPKVPEDSAPQSRYPMIEVGPPNTEPDNTPKASCYPDKPLPPEVEQRWGGQKKNKPNQR